MISNNYQKQLSERVTLLQDYINHIETTYFDKEALKSMSLKKIMERYELAKMSLDKEVDNILKIDKSESGMDATTKTLITIISSMNDMQKEMLKEKVSEIIKLGKVSAKKKD